MTTKYEAYQAVQSRLTAAIAGMNAARKAANTAEARKKAADAAYTAASHDAWLAQQGGDPAHIAAARRVKGLARRRWRAACRRYDACLVALGAAYSEEVSAHRARQAEWARAQ